MFSCGFPAFLKNSSRIDLEKSVLNFPFGSRHQGILKKLSENYCGAVINVPKLRRMVVDTSTVRTGCIILLMQQIKRVSASVIFGQLILRKIEV